MKICPEGAELHVDGQMDRHDEANSCFCSFANALKNVPLKDSEPPRLHHALGRKTKGPQIPANCVTPLQFYMLFFCLSVDEERHC